MEIKIILKFLIFLFASLTIWTSYAQNNSYPEFPGSFIEPFNSFNESFWYKDDYTFFPNKGRFKPQNISLGNDALIMKSPKNTFDGAGIESRNSYGYGSFTARIKCPIGSGLLCSFFLYQPYVGKMADELDIEIFSNGSGRVELVVYSLGQKDHFVPIVLPFDPSMGFHDYRIDYYPSYVSFYADNQLLATFNDILPKNPVKIMSNVWWPSWMPGSHLLSTDAPMYIDWIRYQPLINN